MATTSASIRSFRLEPSLVAHNVGKSVTCMDSKVSYSWTDLVMYLFAYSQICLHLQTGACIFSYINDTLYVFFLLSHFVKSKWSHSTGSFVLHDPEHESLFYIKKCLTLRIVTHLDFRASQFSARSTVFYILFRKTVIFTNICI